MHIAEGFLPFHWCIVWLVLSLIFIAIGIRQMRQINRDIPESKKLLAISGIFISVVSQVGDLLMSLIKRHYGIKDYGKMFPGHGGILDRFDSVIAVSLILAVICTYFNLFA